MPGASFYTVKNYVSKHESDKIDSKSVVEKKKEGTGGIRNTTCVQKVF